MTVVYRLRDASEALLYVGVADDFGRRFIQHARVKPWWSEVVTIELAHYNDRASALEAERAAIVDERPRHNVVHNTRNDERAGVVMWWCKACDQRIFTDGVVVIDIGSARAHLAQRMAKVPFRECDPEPGMALPFHHSCVPVDLEQLDHQGRRAYLDEPLDELTTTHAVLLWAAAMMQEESIGGTYLWALLEEVIDRPEEP